MPPNGILMNRLQTAGFVLTAWRVCCPLDILLLSKARKNVEPFYKLDLLECHTLHKYAVTYCYVVNQWEYM